jgi:prepilin-type N-terminal cleavage/methylation domain-containing protein
MTTAITQKKGDPRDDAGFSLLELLISALILPVVLSAAYLVFITMSGNYSSISAQSEATAEAQRALDTLVREIRQGQEITDGGGAIAVAEPGRCSFYVDVDRDGIPERITYYVDGTDLYRAEGKATTPVYPYNFVDGPAQRVVNLTTSSSVVFTYYDQSDPSQAVTGTPNRATTIAVGIHLSASRPAQNGQVAVDFQTRVKIRALFDSLS